MNRTAKDWAEAVVDGRASQADAFDWINAGGSKASRVARRSRFDRAIAEMGFRQVVGGVERIEGPRAGGQDELIDAAYYLATEARVRTYQTGDAFEDTVRAVAAECDSTLPAGAVELCLERYA